MRKYKNEHLPQWTDHNSLETTAWCHLFILILQLLLYSISVYFFFYEYSLNFGNKSEDNSWKTRLIGTQTFTVQIKSYLPCSAARESTVHNRTLSRITRGYYFFLYNLQVHSKPKYKISLRFLASSFASFKWKETSLEQLNPPKPLAILSNILSTSDVVRIINSIMSKLPVIKTKF